MTGVRTEVVLIEGDTGAQILPTVGDERAQTAAYFSYLAVGADRRRFLPYARIAERMRVVKREVA